ncbi:hypothetical protein [uncultured Methanomethylovorans sp.]|uniref:hypothetical protein n=1 Tax=uncultured Methanomethylovorans sp. TaxID=183759 RepID=UPI003747C698
MQKNISPKKDFVVQVGSTTGRDYFDVYQKPWGSCWPENTPCPAIISEAIYDSILKHFENTFEEEGLFADVENQLVSKQFIGTKWIVFVSYHN